jgi:L-aminopeptidase/D-esterase-like protein
VLNGAGEMVGLTQIQEWGILKTPIVLTNTHFVCMCMPPSPAPAALTAWVSLTKAPSAAAPA